MQRILFTISDPDAGDVLGFAYIGLWFPSKNGNKSEAVASVMCQLYGVVKRLNSETLICRVHLCLVSF